MKKNTFLTALMALGLVAGIDADCSKSNRVFIAPEYKFRKWEFSTGPNGSQNMWGIVGGYQHLASNDIFVRLLASYSEGLTKQGNTLWYDHEWEVELEGGYTFAFGCNCAWKVTPYAGLNYFQDDETISGGPNKEIIGSIPVGLLVGYDINCRWNVQARAQANFEVYRKLNFSGPWLDMSKKTDWLAELPVTYHITPCWDFSLVPFYSFAPNSDFNFSSEWGSINTYGARLEAGYSF